MSAELTIGVDIGGTKTALVVADSGGAIHDACTMPTQPGDGLAMTADRVATVLNRYLDSYSTICGIGIGLPGPVDAERGIALHAANLGWKRAPFRDAIAARLSQPVPITIENDVNAGAVGEQRFGIARGCTDFVYITIGTGIGGAVMIDNRLLHGASNSEMEIGHVALDPINGRLCTCGQRGCLEMSISGKALIAHARQHLLDFADSSLSANTLTTRSIIQAAENNDSLASHVMQEAATALGIGCAWCINLFNPQRLILGGGLVHATWHLLKPRTMATLRARCLPLNYQAANIALSQLTDSALGASALIWHQQKEDKLT